MFDIKRFTVHDGPGIRSTVFTKGCPLDCPWCQNPEGRISGIDLWYFENKCVGCHRCVEACAEKALSTDCEKQNCILIDHGKCTKCGKCVELCPAKALAFDGRIMSSDEVVEELMKDRIFYETSGGGITISGGDPLIQHEFNLEVLKKCKDQGIHTAIETCLHARKEIVERFIEVVDYFIIDIKVFDAGLHRKYVGLGNDIIKENFEFLAAKGVEMLVRIPLIPGYTATEENIRLIARYVTGVNDGIPVELINFNPLGENKYRLMQREYGLDRSLKPYTKDELDTFKDMLKQEGLKGIVEG